MKIQKDQSGFTITELAIAVTVTAVLMTVIFNFMTNSLIQYTNDTNRANLLNSAQTGFETITNDIRLSANADDNNRWSDANAPNNNIFGWKSDADTLVLATATQDKNGNIIFADTANYISQKNNIVYYLSDGKLYKRVIAASIDGNAAKTTCPATNVTPTCPADKLLLSNVVEFRVKYIDEKNAEVAVTEARSIELYAKLQKKTFSQPVAVDYTTRMVFRND